MTAREVVVWEEAHSTTELIFCLWRVEGAWQEERPLFLLTVGTSDARGKNELTSLIK
jgi:hypothetical protein